MGLVKEEKLTSEFVLNRVDEASIFTAYFGPFKLRHTYSSVFRKDKNPSTGFYINKSGKLIYSDIATGEKWDCFAFVAQSFNLTYGGAVRKVACDFGLINCGGRRVFNATEIKRAEVSSEEVKKETIIEIIADSWSPSYLKFWDELYITQEELVREKVYAVKKLFINGKLIPNYSKDIRYAYLVETPEQCYKKIYTPHANDRRFKWISNVPLHIPFGIGDLPFKSNQIIVTKSQKDRILFKKFFTDVIGTQNESPSAINARTRAYLDRRYDVKILNQDLDDAGMNSCQYFMQYGFTPLYVPEIAKEKHGIKDFADFVKHYGLHKMEAYLKHLNIL